MGLSAWKAYRETRWALRVNPSSGNLHPTEAYIVHDGHILHYAPREHARRGTRRRCPYERWEAFLGGHDGFLVALTSIQWREAWKYGERAFRYCQHDVGHAIAALRVSASLFGWTLRLLPEWSDDAAGDAAGRGPRRRSRGCRAGAAGVSRAGRPRRRSWATGDPLPRRGSARSATWQGRANVLSRGHDEWPIIERVTQATRVPGLPATPDFQLPTPNFELQLPDWELGRLGVGSSRASLILQRRSAVAFDGRVDAAAGAIPVDVVDSCDPAAPPFDAIDWPPHVHLALFVHRVDGLVPGRLCLPARAGVVDEWRVGDAARVSVGTGCAIRLFLLLPTDVTWAANRVSCDQEIASDGFFSLGMIARLESALRDRGQWFYRRLFWECGMIGQVLYLEAEAAGARATGIGCFYDDAVHDLLGLTGHEWQSLYHFSMGMPVEDTRLTTERGYPWEAGRQ